MNVHGWDINWQYIVLPGVGQGLVYALLAAGIVLIHRASGVINLAQGAFAVFGVTLMACLVGLLGMAYVPALAVVVVACAIAGALMDDRRPRCSARSGSSASRRSPAVRSRPTASSRRAACSPWCCSSRAASCRSATRSVPCWPEA